jgi:hypothetical protein
MIATLIYLNFEHFQRFIILRNKKKSHGLVISIPPLSCLLLASRCLAIIFPQMLVMKSPASRKHLGLMDYCGLERNTTAARELEVSNVIIPNIHGTSF